MPVVITCTNHCSRCGRHFHSVAAFDAHRRGKYRPARGERGRRCVEPEDAAGPDGEDIFVAITTHGRCTLGIGATQRGITIWTLRMAYERGSEAFTRHRARGGVKRKALPAPAPTPRKRRKRRREDWE